MSYKIYIEVPDGWFDTASPIGWSSRTIRDTAYEAIKNEVTKQMIEKIKLPEIPMQEIMKEVKARIIEKLADDAIVNFRKI